MFYFVPLRVNFITKKLMFKLGIRNELKEIFGNHQTDTKCHAKNF